MDPAAAGALTYLENEDGFEVELVTPPEFS